MSEPDDETDFGNLAALTLIRQSDEAQVVEIVQALRAVEKASPASVMVALAGVLARVIQQAPAGQERAAWYGTHTLIDHFVGLDDADVRAQQRPWPRD